jgi:hypothetical protein
MTTYTLSGNLVDPTGVVIPITGTLTFTIPSANTPTISINISSIVIHGSGGSVKSSEKKAGFGVIGLAGTSGG